MSFHRTTPVLSALSALPDRLRREVERVRRSTASFDSSLREIRLHAERGCHLVFDARTAALTRMSRRISTDSSSSFIFSISKTIVTLSTSICVSDREMTGDSSSSILQNVSPPRIAGCSARFTGPPSSERPLQTPRRPATSDGGRFSTAQASTARQRNTTGACRRTEPQPWQSTPRSSLA